MTALAWMSGTTRKVWRAQVATGHSAAWVRGVVTVAARQERVPLRRLHSPEERREFLREVEKVFDITEPQHWRKVRLGDVVRMPGGRSLLNHYDGSLHSALVDLLPNFSTPAFLCLRKVPPGYWRERQHAREYFDFRAKQLGVEEPEGWAAVPGSSLWKDCGHGLVKEHGSMTAALQFAYPEVEPSRFSNRRCKPKGYWNSPERRRAFVEAMSEELGLSEPCEWKNVSISDIHKHGGAGLISRYGNSVLRMLQDVLPEQEWEASVCRKNMPLRYWEDKSNRKAFLDKAGKQLGVSCLEDWASITQTQFLQVPGSKSLLSRGKLLDMLNEAYGDSESLASFRLRPSTPTRLWQNPAHLRDFLHLAKSELSIKEPGDWARVSNERLRQLPGGSSFVSCGNSLQEALKSVYPDEKWSRVDWQNGITKKAAQHHFKTTVAVMFGYEPSTSTAHP